MLEVSAYTVRYCMGSIVPGSMDPLLLCTLCIESCEFVDCVCVTGLREVSRASSSVVYQRIPGFCPSLSDPSISKPRDQVKTKLETEPE